MPKSLKWSERVQQLESVEDKRAKIIHDAPLGWVGVQPQAVRQAGSVSCDKARCPAGNLRISETLKAAEQLLSEIILAHQRASTDDSSPLPIAQYENAPSSTECHSRFYDRSNVAADLDALGTVLAVDLNMQDAPAAHRCALFAIKTRAGARRHVGLTLRGYSKRIEHPTHFVPKHFGRFTSDR
jgi:hypothetical protein